MNKLFITFITTAILVGGGAFFSGMKYAESKSSTGQFMPLDFQNLSTEQRQQRAQELGGADFRAGEENRPEGATRLGGVNFINGEVISKDENSFTLKLQNGGSRIIFFSDATEIIRSSLGSFGDLNEGSQISINGTENSDGSLTAQSIQLRLDN